LDEVCEVCGLSRKHAIKVLRGKAGTKGRRGRSGRGREYGQEVAKVVVAIWKKAEQPCSVRLKAALPEWLGSYEKRHGVLEEALRAKMLCASARTLERLVATKKAGRKARRWHGRGSHGLKQQIEVRCGRWEVEGPGWMEADTVSHGGGTSNGDYLWSVTLTDIYSGWTELRAVWNCGGSGVCAAVEAIEEALCFALLGFDCDNGPEFLNQHLKRYFERGRKRRQALFWTRSRPYHKNDQAHVEQKNFTHVRQLLGYERLDDVRLVEAVNALYREAWGPLHNYFCKGNEAQGKASGSGPLDQALRSASDSMPTVAQLHGAGAGGQGAIACRARTVRSLRSGRSGGEASAPDYASAGANRRGPISGKGGRRPLHARRLGGCLRFGVAALLLLCGSHPNAESLLL
jgi:hypothetical protein